MEFRHRALLLLLGLTATVGCRQNAAQRELLERELRLQEDRIYELESKLEDSQRALERFQGSSSSGGEFCPAPSSTFRDGVLLESSPSSGSSRSSGGAPATPPTIKPSDIPVDVSPPKVELPMGMRNEAIPQFTGMPVISPPDPDKPEGLPSRGSLLPGVLAELLPKDATGIPKPEPTIKEMSSPKFRSPSEPPRTAGPADGASSRRDNGAAALDDGPERLPGDLTVASVALHRSTGGWNGDGAPGDEGVFVLLEPRNARGEVVPTVGDVSLVLIDPAIVGEGGRYARWDFTAQDAAALYRPAAAGGSAGVHFELAWPEAPPTHGRIKLFVRFTTEDGRRFQAEKDLKLDLGPAAAAVDDVILEPVPLTVTRSAATSSGTQPAAAVGIEPGRATPAVPQAELSDAPLRWGGPKVSTRRQSPTPAPAALPQHSTAPVPTPVVPAADPISEGPSLGPVLVAPQSSGVMRR